MAAHLERIGRFVADLAYERIPASTRRAAKFQLADMIAAAHAAAIAHEVDPVRNGMRAFAAPGRSTVLATSERLGPADAAFANTAYSMAQDFDDIVWMGHTCHSAVFASLAVAEHEASSTRELLCAIVCANEVGGRLGASSLLGPLNGQMWTFIHLAGAAAATSKLLGLDAERTTHALAIALAQPNFALQPGFLLPGSKLLAASIPTATGIQAAYLAQAGMTGFPGILEDRRGFWQRFAFHPLPSMFGDLGELWVLDTLAIKSHPGCHYFQTALTAIERIRERRRFTKDEVDSIEIDTTQLACEATRFASEYVAAGDLSPVAINFDLALSAAVLVYAGRLSPHELDPSWLDAHASDVRTLAARIHVRHDPALSARTLACLGGMRSGREALRSLRWRDAIGLVRRYRAEYRSRLVSARDAWRLAREARALLRDRTEGPMVLPFPSRVAIRFRDGRSETEQVDVPTGTFSLEGSEDVLAEKLGSRALLDRVLAAEDLSVAEIVSAASAPLGATSRAGPQL